MKPELRYPCTHPKNWTGHEMNQKSQEPLLHQISINTLYPTADTLDEAIRGVLDQMEESQRNAMYVALMTYHNTLLTAVADQLKALLPE